MSVHMAVLPMGAAAALVPFVGLCAVVMVEVQLPPLGGFRHPLGQTGSALSQPAFCQSE